MSEQRLIDANQVKRDICQSLAEAELEAGISKAPLARYAAKCLLEAMDEYPTIDPESLRPVGKWVDESDDEQNGGEYSCSCCGYADFFPDGVPLSRYCPCCGARMEEST